MIADPYQGSNGFPVDVSHLRDLVILFSNIILVDTDRVYPDKSISIVTSETLQSTQKVGRHLEPVVRIDPDGDDVFCVAPAV